MIQNPHANDIKIAKRIFINTIFHVWTAIAWARGPFNPFPCDSAQLPVRNLPKGVKEKEPYSNNTCTEPGIFYERFSRTTPWKKGGKRRGKPLDKCKRSDLPLKCKSLNYMLDSVAAKFPVEKVAIIRPRAHVSSIPVLIALIDNADKRSWILRDETNAGSTRLGLSFQGISVSIIE